VRDPNLTPDPNRIRDFLQQVKARSRARSQFERARLGMSRSQLGKLRILDTLALVRRIFPAHYQTHRGGGRSGA